MTVRSNEPKECIDNEQLAALIDNRLSGWRRAQVLEHLDRCEDCFELFSESSRLRLEELESAAAADPGAEREAATRKSLLWVKLSAAAAILLTVFLLFPSVAPVSVAEIAEPLLREEGDLISHLPAASAPAFAELPAGQASFALGTLVTDLYVAVSGDASTEAARFRAQAREILRQASLPGFSIEEANNPQQVAQLDKQLASRLDAREYPLGKWCEALRLAASARRLEFLRGSRVRKFLDSPEARSMPAAALATLRGLQSESDPLQLLDDMTSLDRGLTDFIGARWSGR